MIAIALLSLCASVSATASDGRVARQDSFQRQSRSRDSFFDVKDRVDALKKWRSFDVTLDMNKGSTAASLKTAESSVKATQDLLGPVVAQIESLRKEIKTLRESLPRKIEEESKDIRKQMSDELEEFGIARVQGLSEMNKTINTNIRQVRETVVEASKTIGSQIAASKADIAKSQTTLQATVASSNWCFRWGNGLDQYSASWRTYPGMTCKLTSKTGWVKVMIEGRVYGQNHGGLRITSNIGQTIGTQGTYGVNWMNAQHHGHNWKDFCITRYVKLKKTGTATFTLQYRSQHNGARFHTAGGNYGNQYSGVWWSMEEMPAPMSNQ